MAPFIYKLRFMNTSFSIISDDFEDIYNNNNRSIWFLLILYKYINVLKFFGVYIFIILLLL